MSESTINNSINQIQGTLFTDNPTIGIILCAEKSETVVKYSIINDNPQMFATKFMPYLPTEEELVAEIDRNKIERELTSE